MDNERFEMESPLDLLKKVCPAIIGKPLDSFFQKRKKEKIRMYRTNGYSNGSKVIKPFSVEDANNFLSESILNGNELFFSRWGIVEGNIVHNHLKGKPITEGLRIQAIKNAGIYPNTTENLRIFSDIYSRAAGEITVLNAWFWFAEESELFKNFSPKAFLVSSQMSYPFLLEEPWTFALQGKKVLVIHPFAQLIREQYKKRKVLFENEKVLPDFTLEVYKAVQSLGGNTDFPAWDTALAQMCTDIEKIDFDVALIGCGAYGMPIGAYIKAVLKKQAIHVGGSLQILFGIKGKRWEGNEQGYNFDTRLYNEHWVRPSDNDKPLDFEKIEGGCYW